MRNVDKKFHLLYKTTNLLNEKYYYGIHSTNNIEDGYLGSGKRLRYAIRKYGKVNFKREILQLFDSREALIQAEIDLLTRDILEDAQCMNINFGGDVGTLGRANVKDQDGNTFSIFVDDPRYLSGELRGHSANTVPVYDNGKHVRVASDDPRYLSGDIKHISCGMIPVRDQDGNKFLVDRNDERYLAGNIVHVRTGLICVKDEEGNTFSVSLDDSRYLSGLLVHNLSGFKQDKETRARVGQINRVKQKGEGNSQFGTCWIMKDNENKKIKREELEMFLLQGWSKGRKLK